MVSDQAQRIDAVFHALAHPTRRAMLTRLAASARNIGELAAPFEMTFAGASKHVRVLERAGLVRRKVQGRTHVCTIVPEPLKAAAAWLKNHEHLWSARFDALDAMLKQEDAAAGRRKGK